ncbi:MAG: PASTA domain-containing protein, partial [Polyangiaceae bacterium]|nr:PASTA domain-containing protein [Polyangiaceae bacterium]
MKIFTVAAGLESRLLKATEQIFCEKGAMRVDNVMIRDTHPAGWLPVSQILAQSSNICSAKIGLSLGGERLYQAFRDFGFGQKSGAPVPGESAGRLRPRGRPWVQVETASASFGQGISVTNLQMAMATAAIANGGELMEPLLIKKVTTAAGEVVRDSAPRVRRRVVSQRVARHLAEMLVAVTEGHGTGTEAAVAGHRVAGKTATAQKAEPRTGRYSLDNYVASFTGFVPAQDPKVVISVTIDEPRVNHAGGSVAAPVFRNISEYVLRTFGIAPTGTKQVKLKTLARRADPAHTTHALLADARGEFAHIQEVVDGSKVASGEVKIPNLTGKPMRYSMHQLLEKGLKPQVEGSGLVVRQEPPPGSVVKKGAAVQLTFRPAT